MGYVHLIGGMAVGVISTNVFTTLPVGYSPTTTREFSVAGAAGTNGGTFICVVNTNGECQIVRPNGGLLSNLQMTFLDNVIYNLGD